MIAKCLFTDMCASTDIHNGCSIQAFSALYFVQVIPVLVMDRVHASCITEGDTVDTRPCSIDSETTLTGARVWNNIYNRLIFNALCCPAIKGTAGSLINKNTQCHCRHIPLH